MPTSFRLRADVRTKLFIAAFFVLFLGTLLLLFLLLKPFLGVFLWGVLLTMVFQPLHARIFRWLGGRKNAAAALTTLAVLLTLGLPGTLVVWNAGQEASQLYEALSRTDWNQKSAEILESLKKLKLAALIERTGLDPQSAERALQQSFQSGVQTFSKAALAKLTGLLRNVAGFLVQVGFITFALFFFFRDGARYAIRFVELLPLEPAHQATIVTTFSRTVTAVVRGMVITAVAQGVLAGAGFAVAGAPAPVLLGGLTAVFSMIPFIGAAGVWAPAGAWLALQGQTLNAVGLWAWGAGVVSISDNFLKPILIGGGAGLPIFFLFFTILGGLKLYGFLGVFLGPVILAVAMAFIKIYREVYLQIGEKPKKKRAA